MKKIEIEFHKTMDLSDETICKINELKNQHWKHTSEEHLTWFKKNIRPNDEHLLVWGEQHKLIAYLNLVFVDAEIDNRKYRLFGVGNVCVSKDKKNMGIGAIMMASLNAYLKELKLCGLLLCHDNVQQFYEKCDWKILNVQVAFAEGIPYENRVMFYNLNLNNSESVDRLILDRIF